MRKSILENLLKLTGVRKVNYSFIEFKKGVIISFLLNLLPVLVLYSALFFGLSILFFYLSRIIEQQEFKTTLSEFLYDRRISFLDSYLLNLKLTFTSELPSHSFQPLVFKDLYSSWDNSLVLLSICISTSIILGFIIVSITKNIRSRTSRKIVDYIFGLDRVFSPLFFVSLMTSIFISVKSTNFLLFDQSNPTSWILPVLLISLPTSNFMYRTLLEIEVSWKNSGERKMFFSIGSISNWTKFKSIIKQAIVRTTRSLFRIALGTLILQVLVESTIGFQGAGEPFVKNITSNEIWLSLGVFNIFLVLAYFYFVIEITFKKIHTKVLK